MKRILALLVLLVYLNNANSQLNNLDISYSSNLHFRYDSVLTSIQNNYVIAIIAANINPSWGSGFDKFYILANDKTNWHALFYRIYPEPIAGHTFFLDTLSIPTNILDSVFDIFKGNNFWSITSEMRMCIEDINQTNMDSIHTMIRDASTQQIATFYKGNILNVKEYYAAEHHEKLCPPNNDRSIFLKGYKALLTFKNYLRN